MDGGFVRRVSPLFTGLLTSPRTRDARRWLAERRRRLRSEPHRVHYFHQVDDPYGALAAQVLPRLVERYEIELVPHLVNPPSDAAAPERTRLEAFSRRDAADVAPAYGLAFPAGASAPDPALVARAAALLASAIAANAFTSAAARASSALWSGDGLSLAALEREVGSADAAEVRARSADGDALRDRLGHYLGAMFHYGGEWYWGVDRLWHLERRLQSLGALRASASAEPILRRPAPQGRASGSARRTFAFEFYPSLRSPYTAIAIERALDLARRYAVELVLRPVLPMVMRGLPVPRAKQLYIALDTKREAEDAGVPFGRICDPVGRPVERAFSLYPWARERGRAAELLASFASAAFAEGIDTGSDTGLRRVVERAGLPWAQAIEHLDREGWRDELEANRLALFELGLWGVPSFCLRAATGEALYSTWGQDRLFRVEQEIAARLAP
ncbi:MAG: 2-hydroxychromene-2-carboxylate isomerase [Deltaproteobacteria bacterium]|nr:2-hydroxychromene-2-carboxylate isomerase [Deltaproteobacteria bacterium]